MSGGEPWYDASLTPLSARMVIGIDGKTYRTNPVAVKPYESPLDIPNLQLWLDASDIATVSTPPTISSWLDKSSNALTATQSVIGNQPTLLYNEINNLNALSFNSANNNHFNLSSPIFLSGNYSHFFVYKRPSTSAISQSLGNKAGPQSSFLHWSTQNIYSGNIGTSSQINLTGTLIGGTRKNEYLQLDLTPYALSNWSGSTTTSVNTVGVYNNTSYHNGLIGEIIHTGSLLPNEEINLVNSKLFDKWKIAKIPPYIKSTLALNNTTISNQPLSSNLGTWFIEPNSYRSQWSYSSDGTIFIPISSTLKNITPSRVDGYPSEIEYLDPRTLSLQGQVAQERGYLLVSVTAYNAFGASVPVSSNVVYYDSLLPSEQFLVDYSLSGFALNIDELSSIPGYYGTSVSDNIAVINYSLSGFACLLSQIPW